MIHLSSELLLLQFRYLFIINFSNSLSPISISIFIFLSSPFRLSSVNGDGSFFVSNRHKGLLATLPFHFPVSKHLYCVVTHSSKSCSNQTEDRYTIFGKQQKRQRRDLWIWRFIGWKKYSGKRKKKEIKNVSWLDDLDTKFFFNFITDIVTCSLLIIF